VVADDLVAAEVHAKVLASRLETIHYAALVRTGDATLTRPTWTMHTA